MCTGLGAKATCEEASKQALNEIGTITAECKESTGFFRKTTRLVINTIK
jgi:hypothetical protein